MLAAMMPAAAVLALHYPLIADAAALQTYTWAPALWGQIPTFYASSFLPMLALVAGPALITLAVSTAASADERHIVWPDVPAHEWTVICGLSLMPLLLIGLATFTTNLFTPRYALWVLIGFALLNTLVLATATTRYARVGPVVACSLAALLVAREFHSTFLEGGPRYSALMSQELSTLPEGEDPVVVANVHVFMELAYYTSSPLRERLVFPLSKELDLRYTGVDSIALLMDGYRRHSLLRVEELDDLLRQHSRFILAAEPFQYLQWHLVSKGYRVTPIASFRRTSSALGAVTPILFAVEGPAVR
jgi:hypothetical protein